MPLSRHSAGTYPEMSLHTTSHGTFGQSSQLTKPLWTGPGIKRGISVHELFSISEKKKKKHRQGQGMCVQVVGFYRELSPWAYLHVLEMLQFMSLT